MEPVVSAGANLIVTPSTPEERVLARNPLMALAGQYGRVAIGGWLHVYPGALVFQSHSVNFSRPDGVIRFEEIADMRTSWRMASALLVITTTTGHVLEFVCWRRTRVIEAVRRLRGW